MRSFVLIFCCLSFCGPVIAGEVGIDIFGFSYHPDRRDSSGKKLNEFNPGIGMNYIFHETNRSIFSADAGVYRDSGRNAAIFGAAGYRLKFDRISLGGMVVVLKSDTFNNGNIVIAPLPVFSVRVRAWSFNATYLPQYKNVNRNDAFGFFATFHLGSSF